MWVCNNFGLDCEYESIPMDRLHSKEVSKTSIVFRVITSKPTQWPKSSLDGLVFTTMIVGKLVFARRSRKSEESDVESLFKKSAISYSKCCLG
ncbi:uncharacterized protein LOC136030219 isoform X2 [Artemia franciscana]|uniref:uncharacterized protein LOC136030219 isoform X2 n=1 Tax=Artemia franciscana TaxID=6661 RepID=UPI0032DA469B